MVETPPAESAADDTAAKESDVIKGPDEYRFEVKIDDIVSEQPSNHLWLTRDMHFKVQDEKGEPMPDGTEVRITMANGIHRYAAVTLGKVHFEKILVGHIQTSITHHTHRKEEAK